MAAKGLKVDDLIYYLGLCKITNGGNAVVNISIEKPAPNGDKGCVTLSSNGFVFMRKFFE